MELEVCRFGKFGFCRFKESCKRKHFLEVCESKSQCKNIKECHKRHPKPCRRFNLEQECIFKGDCAYSHCDSNLDSENNELKAKVEDLEKRVIELTNEGEGKRLKHLEKVVHALTRTVLCLKDEIKDMKNKSDKGEEEINENPKSEESSFNHNEIKHSSSTPKEKDVKEKVHKVKSKEELLYCKECDYKCKKEIYLKKHMLSTHGDHTCNECKEKLTTFMELLKHVAKHHYKEGETEEKISEGEAFDNIENLKLIKKSDHMEEVAKEKAKGLGLK